MPARGSTVGWGRANTPHMPRRTRWKPAAAIGLGLGLAVAAYAGYWRYAAGQFDRSVAGWIAEREAEGYRIQMTLAPVEGFPLWLSTEVGDPAVAAPDDAWTWRGPTFHLRSRPWSPLAFTVHLPGAHHFATQGRDFELAAAGADGRIAYGFDGRLTDFAVELRQASLTEVGEPPIAAARITLGARVPPPDDGGIASVTLAFEAEVADLALPSTMRPALGPLIAAASTAGRVAGPILPGPLPTALAAWRDAGGTIELDRFQMRWGPLGLDGSATVALDDALQPLVAASCEMQGIGPTFDALMDAGVIDREHGPLGKQLLLGMAGADGKLKLPLTLQGGFLYVGPIKLMPVPPIAW
jgi:Uncharacterized protein conserved in bacteria (DUF2125)